MAIVYTVDEVMEAGLVIIGKGGAASARVLRKTNKDRFTRAFGSHPLVYASIWEDLQKTNATFMDHKTRSIISAQIDTTKEGCTLRTFLVSIRFLRTYDTEFDRSNESGRSDRWCRDWGWYFLYRVAAMRQEKIVWPDDDQWKTIFIISVDGVQCRWHEETTPDLLKDKKNFAHKFHGPGFGYHIALHLFENRCVFLHGPVQPGIETDSIIYMNYVEPLVPAGKKVIVDGGYKGDDPKLSRPNVHDPKELRVFKRRARSRQENFHARIKRFEALVQVFRHKRDRHRVCFEAATVICCYEIDLVSPLPDV